MTRTRPSCGRQAVIGLVLLLNLFVASRAFAYPPPVITVQPLSQTVPILGTVTFSVTVSTTTSVSYQWYKNGLAISGETLSSFTIYNAQASDQATYTVKATNAGGSVTSSGAVLTVLLPPTITTQPASQAVAVGGSALFSVAASGMTPFSYQWYLSGSALTGATSSALSLTNVQTTNAGGYTVVVANLLGSATSAAATLTVYVPPTLTNQPQSQAVIRGQNAAFSVAASGSTPFTYQWYLNGISLGSGAQSPTLTITGVKTSDAGAYTVVVGNPGGLVTSAVAMLTVYVPPNITAQPGNQTVLQGQTSSFSVSLSASGTKPFSYQWNVNGLNPPGATNTTLTITNARPTDAGSYFVVVTNLGGSATSHVGTLTIAFPALITNQPQSLMVTQGQTASFLVGAGGTALSYQWYFNGTPVPGATGAALALTGVQTSDAGGYAAVVTNSWSSATSTVATLAVTNPVVALSLPAGTGMTGGGFTFQLSVPAGRTYVILATTNLQDWDAICTNVAQANIVTVTDAAATNFSRRFYRAVVW